MFRAAAAAAAAVVGGCVVTTSCIQLQSNQRHIPILFLLRLPWFLLFLRAQHNICTRSLMSRSDRKKTVPRLTLYGTRAHDSETGVWLLLWITRRSHKRIATTGEHCYQRRRIKYKQWCLDTLLWTEWYFSLHEHDKNCWSRAHLGYTKEIL